MNQDFAQVAHEALARHAAEPGALLPTLHDIQDRLGHVPPSVVPLLAEALMLSRAEVHGVLTYYHHFRSERPGRHIVQVCRAEACQAMGADALLAHAERRLGCPTHAGHGRTGVDGRYTLTPVFCLGLCASAPAVVIDERLQGRVTPERLDRLIDALEGETMSAAPLLTRDAGAAARPAAVTLYVPRDSAARAVGADAVAEALLHGIERRGAAARIVRNGSRGLFWLEPLVEVETAAGRIAYGPVAPEDVESLLDAGLLTGAAHPLGHGPVEAIPYLARQQRLTFARMGVTDPLSLADYQAHGGWVGLRAALAMTPGEVVQQVLDSGLRGRGGAAFPTGIKWRTVAAAPAGQKYVVCNADEGDSGTFSDRMTMEGDPYLLIEGMAIAGLAVGATEGLVYIRSEYPDAVGAMGEAVARATAAGFLGADVLGSGRAFRLQVRKAAGAYVCGEETAMLESLEGRRGIVRAKPPLPALAGLFGRPTVINNVISLASVPTILARGAAFYRDHGVGRSRGTLPIQLAGNIRCGGLVELAFGATLRQLLHDFGGGTASGRPIKAVQVGGPLGAYVPESKWDVPFDYEAYAAFGGTVGHGGIVVHDDTADLSKLARYAMEFCAIESCGKCTPCRIGSTRGVEVIDRIRAGRGSSSAPGSLAQGVPQQIDLLRSLCDTMAHGSLCAMGGMTPFPVLSALDHYPEDFGLPRALQDVVDPHAHDPGQPEQRRLDPAERDRPSA